MELTIKTVAIYIALFILSKWLIPKIILQSPPKAIKVINIDGTEVKPVDPSFDWQKKEPHQYRPFKKVYFMTMGVTRSSRDDWLRVEANYRRMIEIHKAALAKSPDQIALLTDCSKTTRAAVAELYDEIVKFFAAKYPNHFVPTGNVLANLILNTELPRTSQIGLDQGLRPLDFIKLIVENVEEDFNLLEHNPQTDEYVLRAATGVGANGFSTLAKMNQKLTNIHRPVPQYLAKLRKSMNKYFYQLKPGAQWVQRLTWGIQVGPADEIFKPSGNHAAADQVLEPLPLDSLDFENGVHMRVERQMLSKLPETEFVVFAVRTYMYPLAAIKREGLGEEMAQAIEAWPDDIAHYKSRPRWGPAVLSYLRQN